MLYFTTGYLRYQLPSNDLYLSRSSLSQRVRNARKDIQSILVPDEIHFIIAEITICLDTRYTRLCLGKRDIWIF